MHFIQEAIELLYEFQKKFKEPVNILKVGEKMGMEKWISREEESQLPDFKSHEEARNYFKEKYGNDFQLTNSDYIDGRKCYFYILIHDKEVYWDNQRRMKEDGFTTGLEFMASYQPIEIWEDGGIHIIH